MHCMQKRIMKTVARYNVPEAGKGAVMWIKASDNFYRSFFPQHSVQAENQQEKHETASKMKSASIQYSERDKLN